MDSRLDRRTGNQVTAGSLGALWPEEAAWKLRVEFKRLGRFPEHELLRAEHVVIPGAEEVLEPQTAYSFNGAKVVVAKLIGSRVDYNQVRRLNVDRKDWLVHAGRDRNHSFPEPTPGFAGG